MSGIDSTVRPCGSGTLAGLFGGGDAIGITSRTRCRRKRHWGTEFPDHESPPSSSPRRPHASISFSSMVTLTAAVVSGKFRCIDELRALDSWGDRGRGRAL